MVPLTTTRTLFELRVGRSHSIEVLLQIRLSDIAWWNSNLHHHERQLYKLIGRRVLPVECREEIEADRAKMREREAANSNLKKKGDVVIGEANLKKKGEKEKNSGKKRGVGNKAKKENKSSKKTKVSGGNVQKGVENKSEYKFKDKKLKLLREPGKWVMGKSIQICYMMEEIDSSSATTLIFRPKENCVDSANEILGQKSSEEQSRSPTIDAEAEEKLVPLATFRSWKKLSKRLNLWAFKFNPGNPSDLSVSEGGGFPRPEMLPMSDIFRSPRGED